MLQTVCTRLPVPLLTQEPGIKAMQIPPQKPLSPGCGDANLFKQTFIIYMPLQHRPVALGWSLNNSVYMYQSRPLFLQLTWTCAEFYVNLSVLMHLYTCKYLLNTLGRAVQQLAGCLAKQSKSQQLRSKYNSMQCQREGLKCNMNS